MTEEVLEIEDEFLQARMCHACQLQRIFHCLFSKSDGFIGLFFFFATSVATKRCIIVKTVLVSVRYMLFHVATMFIDICKTGKYVRHLLRESYRKDGKVKHRTVGNLSNCTDQQISAIRWALGFEGELPPVTATVSDVVVRQGLSIGAVVALQHMCRTMGLEKALGSTQAGKRAAWQVMARIMDQGSRLSAVRLAGAHAVCDVLALEEFCEDDLYQNLDWLSENQQAIEQALFKEAPPEGKCDLFLYDACPVISQTTATG